MDRLEPDFAHTFNTLIESPHSVHTTLHSDSNLVDLVAHPTFLVFNLRSERIDAVTKYLEIAFFQQLSCLGNGLFGIIVDLKISLKELFSQDPLEYRFLHRFGDIL